MSTWTCFIRSCSLLPGTLVPHHPCSIRSGVRGQTSLWGLISTLSVFWEVCWWRCHFVSFFPMWHFIMSPNSVFLDWVPWNSLGKGFLWVQVKSAHAGHLECLIGGFTLMYLSQPGFNTLNQTLTFNSSLHTNSVAQDLFGALGSPWIQGWILPEWVTPEPITPGVIWCDFSVAFGTDLSFLFKCSLSLQDSLLMISLQPPRLTNFWIFLNVVLNIGESSALSVQNLTHHPSPTSFLSRLERVFWGGEARHVRKRTGSSFHSGLWYR